MTEKKTLYISDLDGTLLNKNATLSAYTKDALNKFAARGIHFTVATGRTTDAAKQIMAGVELSVPIVTFNGTILYDTMQDSYVKVYHLTDDAVRSILAVLKTHGVTGLAYECRDGTLTAYYEPLTRNPICDFMEDRSARYRSVFRRTDDFRSLSPEHIMYFSLLDTYDHIWPVYHALKSLPGMNLALVDDEYGSDLWFLEVFSAEASKQHAVTFLRKEYGYESVVGFGDNSNDLPMFKACDVRVAVRNAKDDVRAAADCICPSYAEDGVVKWIERNISEDLSPSPTDGHHFGQHWVEIQANRGHI